MKGLPVHISVISPLQLKKQLAAQEIVYSYYQTAGGCLQLAELDGALFEAKFVEADKALGRQRTGVCDRLLLVGTPFQVKVWQAALAIPTGSTLDYEQLAVKIGAPKAYRAVANALGQNKIAYFIPCHRVVRKNGALSGYRWGVERKEALLASEG